MKHSSATFTLLLSIFTHLAIAQTSNPPCVKACISSFPVSSFCDGDETGEALSQCTCQSLQGQQMITCIKKCSPSDQSVFASHLPATCAASLFPNLGSDGEGVTGVSATTSGAKPSTAASTGAATGSSSSASAATTSAGATKSPSPASSTSSAAAASSSGAAHQVLSDGSLVVGAAAIAVLLL